MRVRLPSREGHDSTGSRRPRNYSRGTQWPDAETPSHQSTMKTFLIFGRPRCRSAWAANFLTYGNSFCFHEGLADSSGSMFGLKCRMVATGSPIVGNADTGLIHCVDEALEMFPNASLVMLTENLPSWGMFAYRHSIPRKVFDEINTAYQYAKKRLKDRALFLPCSEMTEIDDAARVLWNHCTDMDENFNLDRLQLLRDLNIQVIPESLASRLSGPSR